ncbi:hypothetical protein C0991_001027 [Blastosporella zonata]|nr:hypothetical protein C0991_001027 [Blastosporella zonata]
MSEQIEESSPSAPSPSFPLDVYISYPFDSDETYQQGLASLIAGGTLGGDLTTEEKEEMMRRTRVFYFNRVTGNALSVEEVRVYESSRNQPQPNDDTGAANASEETRVLTFAELQELIESGKVDQIPNNKVISERLNDAPPSESTAPARKKPWEVESES